MPGLIYQTYIVLAPIYTVIPLNHQSMSNMKEHEISSTTKSRLLQLVPTDQQKPEGQSFVNILKVNQPHQQEHSAKVHTSNLVTSGNAML